jgi:hypothetical protein
MPRQERLWSAPTIAYTPTSGRSIPPNSEVSSTYPRPCDAEALQPLQLTPAPLYRY